MDIVLRLVGMDVGEGEFPKIVDNFGECTGKPYVWVYRLISSRRSLSQAGTPTSFLRRPVLIIVGRGDWLLEKSVTL